MCLPIGAHLLKARLFKACLVPGNVALWFVLSISSSQTLIPSRGLLPPVRSLFSCFGVRSLPPGEILKSGVVISFRVSVSEFVNVYHPPKRVSEKEDPKRIEVPEVTQI